MIHSNITSKIIHCALKVHNTLGNGYLEKIYENAMLIECNKTNLEVVNQKAIPVYYDNEKIGHYMADLLIENTVLVELKAVKGIEKVHMAQLLHYLKATGLKVGLIINFGTPSLEIKRMVF